LRENEYGKTTVNLEKNIKLKSLKIAKKRGINTLSTLVNTLLNEYVDKYENILSRELQNRGGVLPPP
jgi:metal-responsive CopG/Arc/MetJ family transcriptional regulator